MPPLKNNFVRWTEQEDTELKKLIDSELELHEISEKLNRTPTSVKLRIIYLNRHSKDKLTDTDMENQVNNSLKEESAEKKTTGLLSYHSEPWTIEQERIAYDLHKRGLSNKDIGLRIGRTEASIQSRVSKINVHGFMDEKPSPDTRHWKPFVSEVSSDKPEVLPAKRTFRVMIETPEGRLLDIEVEDLRHVVINELKIHVK